MKTGSRKHDSELPVLRDLCRRLGAFGHDVDPFDDGAVFVDEHLEHLTSLAFVLTGDDHHCIVFLDM